MLVPWYYRNTNEFFSEILKESVESEFELKAVSGQKREESVLCALIEARAKGIPYIVFSDVDLIIKPGLYTALKPYMADDNKNDMCLLNYYSGFMLLRVSQNVIDFWKTPSSLTIDDLKSYPGTCIAFDKQFTSTDVWDGKSEYVVLEVPCSLTDGYGASMNMAEKVFCLAQHMDLEPYMKYVPSEAIESIYKFQEIYIRSYQEAKKEAASIS
jgi:hypothetical protein